METPSVDCWQIDIQLPNPQQQQPKNQKSVNSATEMRNPPTNAAAQKPTKRKRATVTASSSPQDPAQVAAPSKKGRGRPPKEPLNTPQIVSPTKRKRPLKNTTARGPAKRMKVAVTASSLASSSHPTLTEISQVVPGHPSFVIQQPENVVTHSNSSSSATTTETLNHTGFERGTDTNWEELLNELFRT
ncbi:hypothetical protein Dda_6923 [Drechslerella dactyloides]|uniref:Uncharacterized protein n=1 Tax=Drechslerella dactyloides TaxID=74499 RepID=A0AAD6NFW6_DREDA|nr:hypothetical protein Dda_6923 [Drechslerella dactyloides]